MSILVVDHHVLFRQGLVSLLNNYPGLEVAGEAEDAGEMLEKAFSLQPDIILVSADNAPIDVIPYIHKLLTQRPLIKVIVLYSRLTEDLLFASLRAGVKGFISKDIDQKNLILSLNALRRGELALSRSLVNKVVEEYIRLGKTARENNPHINTELGLDKLTPREVQVLTELGKHAKNQLIAKRLSISENTVRVHIHHILDKLCLPNRSVAGEFATRAGLCEDYRAIE